MPRPRGEQLAIEARRRKVAELWLAHAPQEEIGREVGVNQATISRDIKAIRDQFRAERDEILDRETAELDHIERECVTRYQQDLTGDWIDRRLKVKERRSKLLGLDAPAKVEQSGPGGGPHLISLNWENAPSDISDADEMPESG